MTRRKGRLYIFAIIYFIIFLLIFIIAAVSITPMPLLVLIFYPLTIFLKNKSAELDKKDAKARGDPVPKDHHLDHHEK